MRRLLAQKPKEVYFENPRLFYEREFSLLYRLRHRLIHQNPTLSYYLVSFTIPTNQKETIYYYEKYKNKWFAKQRIINESGPSCVTIGCYSDNYNN